MKHGASQRLRVQMARGSSFCFLPHPCVPHKDSSFTAINEIYLADQCSLIWGEVLTCGRKLSGEVFLFSKYHALTKIFIHNRLVIKENMLIQPTLTDVNALGQWEGFTHQASLIYLHEQAAVKPITNFLSTYLSKQPAIAFGITAAPVNGLIVRLLGHKAEQLHGCLKMIAQHLSKEAYNPAIVDEIDPSKSISYAD